MTAPAARIGFQLPDDHVRAVTGFCAAELAVERANAEGRLPARVELVPVIDGRDDATARAAAERFAADPTAIAMLGPLNSAMAVATQPIYAAAGFAQLSSEASSPLLTDHAPSNFFRLVANDHHQGRALAQTALYVAKRERIAILHDASAWGRPIAEIVQAELQAQGVEPVLFYGFGAREHALDVDELVRQTMDARPDLVYFAVYWNKAHIIAHKLRYLGSRAVFLGSDALKPYAFLEVPSLDPEPPYHTLAGVDMRLKPSARPFLREFALAYPTMLAAPQYAAEAYDCASILLTAFERAGRADRGAVLAEVQRIAPYEGAIGRVHFDGKGDLVDPEIGLYRCRDGQRHYLGAVADLVAQEAR
jgi:branched-chain amino acid transport system substrate-binding protein